MRTTLTTMIATVRCLTAIVAFTTSALGADPGTAKGGASELMKLNPIKTVET